MNDPLRDLEEAFGASLDPSFFREERERDESPAVSVSRVEWSIEFAPAFPEIHGVGIIPSLEVEIVGHFKGEGVVYRHRLFPLCGDVLRASLWSLIIATAGGAGW